MARVAAIQMLHQIDPQQQLLHVELQLQHAKQQCVDLVVLPENFLCMGLPAAELLKVAQQEFAEPKIIPFLQRQAKQLGLWIVAGTVPTIESVSQPKPYTTSFVINPSGNIVGQYNKIHLFDAAVSDTQKHYRESDSFLAGEDVVVVATPIGNIGLSVCYDLRFPELYKAMRGKGADIIVVPSAFTSITGEAHWRALLIARAIETQCYVVGANMGDRHHPKRPTWGGSCIVHPWGNVLAECEAGSQLIVADIDMQELLSIRQNMPVLEHTKLV